MSNKVFDDSFSSKTTVDPLASNWKNKPSMMKTPPAKGGTIAAPGPTGARDATWVREGYQTVVTRDGQTGTVSCLEGVDASGNIISVEGSIPAVNDRWDDTVGSPYYNLICVSVKKTPYAKTVSGAEQFLFTCEFSSQPLDPVEVNFGGDFISVKGTEGSPSAFKWADDDKAVTQTLHKATLSVKFKVTKRRSTLPYDDIVARLGCVNNDSVNILNNAGGISCTIPGTNKGVDPQDAFLLFEGCQAVETTDPNGGVMWKIIYNLTAKYNWDSYTGKAVGWNSIFKDSTGSFELVYVMDGPTKKYLYRDTDLSKLIADDKET